MKKLNNAFSVLMMIIVLILGVLVYKDFEKQNKFEKQNLGTNLELFKDYWGNPDKKFVDKSELILIYNSSEKVTAIAGTITLTVQCIALIATIFPTENALKKTFNDDGTRK